MKNHLEKLRREAQHITLTQQEKNAMRASIFGVPSVSPGMVRSSYNWFSIRFAVPVALLLVVVLGSGTVYASQGAVPGDALYSIKVNVAEPVQGALATSNEAKANFHTQVAVTRIEEAETLASRGDLTASTSDALAANFETNVSAANAAAQTLGETDPAAAAEASAQIDSSLSAHSDILQTLGDQSTSSTTKENSTVLAQNVRAHVRGHDEDTSGGPIVAIATVAPRAMMTAKMVPVSASAPSPAATDTETESENTQTQGDALALQAKAASALSDLQHSLGNLGSNVDASTLARLQAQVNMTSALMDEGSTTLAAGDATGATMLFTQALNRAIKLSAFVSASNKFDNHILRSLLGDQ